MLAAARYDAAVVASRFLRPIALVLLLGLAGSARAERLALKSYTTADGLAHNHVYLIVQDSHGFMWFCTRSGLSRFDGYRFTTYSTEQGLPDPTINYLLESRSGVYWIATNGGGIYDVQVDRHGALLAVSVVNGLYRLSPDGRVERRTNLPAVASSLIRDREGRVWVATPQGLYLMVDDPKSGQLVIARTFTTADG